MSIKPQYTDPESVLSPKGAVADLRVLLNTGEDGWAVASMQWNGEDALGIRWNGHPGNPLGSPQSRGIPTWFIVPAEVASILHGRFGDSSGGLEIQDADITRVRVRPQPQHEGRKIADEDSDDVWVLSITDRTRGCLEIMNPRTQHFLALNQSHVKSLVRETAHDKPNGPKHGILDLNVQIVFEDSRLRLEPLQSITGQVDDLLVQLRQSGYDGKHDRIRTLIQDCRMALVQKSGELGPWESERLDCADAAVAANFLRLALNEVRCADAVSKLPRDEYERGFYSNREPRPRQGREHSAA
jgi:hypothetical protein